MPNPFLIDTGFQSNVVPAVSGLVNNVNLQRQQEQQRQHEAGIAETAFGNQNRLLQQRQDFVSATAQRGEDRADRQAAAAQADKAAAQLADEAKRNEAARLVAEGTVAEIAEFIS